MKARTESEYSLDDLAGRTGIPARTIRFYIAQGLLAPPLRAGRGAAYGSAHLERLDRIQELKGKGLTLTEIRTSLDPAADPPRLSAPTTVWSYRVAPDVTVLVQAGTSPWRMKRVQKALNDLAARLEAPQEDEVL